MAKIRTAAWSRLALPAILAFSSCDPSALSGLISPRASDSPVTVASPAPDTPPAPTTSTPEPFATIGPDTGPPILPPDATPVPVAPISIKPQAYTPGTPYALAPQLFTGELSIMPEMDDVYMPLEMGVSGSLMLGRRYTIYAGPTSDFAFQIDLKQPLPTNEDNKIVVRGGDGRELATIRKSSVISVTGNVATIDLFWDGQGEVPVAEIKRFRRNASGGAFPVEVSSVSNKVASMPVTLNQPIDIFSNLTNAAQLHFFTVKGVRGKNIDLVLDGDGELYINEPSLGFYFPGSANLTPFEQADASTGHMIHLQNCPYDTLLLSMRFDQDLDDAHARLSVNEVNDAFDFTVRFPGSLSDYGVANSQELSSKLAGIVKMASRSLYQVSAGHSRIKGVKVLLGTTTQVGTKTQMRVDPYTSTSDQLRSRTRNGQILVNLEWWNRGADKKHPGFTMAHEFLHQRYKLRDEYEDEMNTEWPPNLGDLSTSRALCPISNLAGSYPEFCWQGNHNPTGSSLIRERNDDPDIEGTQDRSAWEIYAKSLSITPPDRHPPQVLKSVDSDPNWNRSRVDFPLTISVDTGPQAPTGTLPPISNPFD